MTLIEKTLDLEDTLACSGSGERYPVVYDLITFVGFTCRKFKSSVRATGSRSHLMLCLGETVSLSLSLSLSLLLTPSFTHSIPSSLSRVVLEDAYQALDVQGSSGAVCHTIADHRMVHCHL